MKILLFLSFCFLLVPTSTLVSAYGKLGHYVIGEVVYERLSNHTKQRIEECGYLEPFNGSMGNASLWADIIKGNPRYRWTSALHYYDVDNDPPSYCGHVDPPSSARAQNLMNGLSRATANLTCSNSSKKRMQGTCCGSFFHFNMYIHLVQDMYQPLHLTGKERGGNNRTFEKDGRKYNLHRYWDSDGLDLLMKDEIGKDYTLHDAVEYFRNVSATTAGKQCAANSTAYIYKEANCVSSENCKIVWDTDSPHYITLSKDTIRDLVSRSINALQCLLDTIFSKTQTPNSLAKRAR